MRCFGRFGIEAVQKAGLGLRAQQKMPIHRTVRQTETRPGPSRTGFLIIEQKRPGRSEIVQDPCGTFLTVSTHAHEYKARRGRS